MLKTKIEELQQDLSLLEKLLPKPDFKQEEEPHSIQEKSEKKETIEDELDKIKRKLASL